ncbi:MAG TPA: phosphonate ABC transporter, permease protein PhnE, partial [Methanocella sp.]|nr:phosphonate ABC transporter, permease protein PhnE [Methanocella sp.]
TILGVIISLPMGFLMARNTAPGTVVYHVTRFLVTFFRTAPSMVWALIFVVSFGIGAVPGILGLTISTIGMLSKFYSEAIESIDPKPVEALNATGGHGLSVIRHAIIPQVTPIFTSYTLYTLDSNIRGAVLMGLVGAGGIGGQLLIQMNRFNYQNVSTILIMIVVLVALINRTSAYLRKGIIEGTIFKDSRRYLDYAIVIIGGVVCVAFLLVTQSDIDWGLFITGWGKTVWMLGKFSTISFTYFDSSIDLMKETIMMAIAGSVIAIIIAIPLGIAMARNLNKNMIVANSLREICNMFRAIPEMVLAIFFVAAVGMGPFAGVIAIALHSAGVLGEFYAGAIENIDSKPVEAIEATGASFAQRIRHAIFPQIWPIVNSNNLYILDRNIRDSTILGMVGAGGIGILLSQTFRMFYLEDAVQIIIVMVVTIAIIDSLSAYIRKRLV